MRYAKRKKKKKPGPKPKPKPYQRITRFTRERLWQLNLAKQGEGAFLYIWDMRQELIEVDAVHQEYGHRIRINYPVARLYSDGIKIRIPWTEETLTKAMQGNLDRIRKKHGGPWELEFAHVKIHQTLLKG